MGSEWPSARLDELTATPITYGVVKPGSEDPDGPLFVRGGDVDGGRVLIENLRTITKEISHQYSRTLLQGGEILVSLVGNPGQVGIVPTSLKGANIARQVGLIRPKMEYIDTRFLLYFLLSPQGQAELGSHSRGSVQQVINLRDLKTVVVPVPPLAEQKAIAGILGALDDKIELNRRMNATLEEMARALFHDWFVDFGPVRRKLAGLPTGLAPHIDALFPATLVDSELGEIPQGWGVKPIGELFSFVIGGTWGQDEMDDKHTEIARVIRGTDFGNLSVQNDEKVPERFITPQALAKRRLTPGDIVLEVSGGSRDQPTGRTLRITPGIISRLGDLLVPASFCRLIRPYTQDISLFLWLHLMELYDSGGTWAYQNQSTGISNFQFKYFAESELVTIPSINSAVLTAFGGIVEQLGKQIDNKNYESVFLSSLRDALLPKLISGELRVGESTQFPA